jgi:DNA-binding SARP family transcriptional activator
MEFRILGPLEAREGGATFALGGPKQRAVLALLLLHANQVVTTDRLIDQLWGEEPPETVRTVVQGYVSNLRKTLGPDLIRTRASGYAIVLDPEELDLHRFERLLELARTASGAGDSATAAAKLRDALGLWSGPALADFAYESFAQAPILRLEELRFAALEDRIEADLALGRHGELVGELEALVAQHPLRERLRGQLMLALYRSGRQSDALQAYHETRRVLVEELGIEPTQTLQGLERAILRQDSTLELASSPSPGSSAERLERAQPGRSIVLVAPDEGGLDALLALAGPLARQAAREIILAALVSDETELAAASELARERRARLTEEGQMARSVAFTSTEPGKEAVRLAAQQKVDLLLLDTSRALLAADELGGDLVTVLAEAPCDVALLIQPAGSCFTAGPKRPVLVPFGGAEHEWAAAELGAWIAAATGAPLVLVGTAADRSAGRRDASRLLATASLVIQQVAGVHGEPLLVSPGPDAIVGAARTAGIVCLGLSDRWRQEGVGRPRLAVARGLAIPTLLVCGGVRPGGLAPEESMSRYTWTMASESGSAEGTGPTACP